MPELRGAAVSITVSADNRGTLCTVRPVTGGVLETESFLTEGGLREQRSSLRTDLEHFKDCLGDGARVGDWARVDKAMQRLHGRGNRLAHQLFGGRCGKVAEALRIACPAWHSETPERPLVEVKAGLNEVVPIELLPLFNMRLPPAPIDSLVKLRKAACSFVGFSTIVRRVVVRTRGRTVLAVDRDLHLDELSKLPTKAFWDARLPGARAEAKFFQGLEHCMALDGPWPDRAFGEDQLVRCVAEHLLDPSLKFDGTLQNPEDQLQHFACHCDTQGRFSEEHYLTLAHELGGSQEVTLGRLHEAMAALLDGSPDKADARKPLVFLNACGGSKIDPDGATSFPGFFLGNGNRGFIGSEAGIPDEAAARFSREFYAALLRGESLGRALWLAKYRLLTRFNNPVGILYTAYADPDMAVHKGRDVWTRHK